MEGKNLIENMIEERESNIFKVYIAINCAIISSLSFFSFSVISSSILCFESRALITSISSSLISTKIHDRSVLRAAIKHVPVPAKRSRTNAPGAEATEEVVAEEDDWGVISLARALDWDVF